MYLYYFSADGQDSPNIEGLVTFSSFFIIFNTLIPISIMVTMEVVKGIQVFYINNDKKLFLEADEKLNVLSMKLHEDLGEVRYIFTDKTGTLTKNEMCFKSCSIFTRLFDESVSSSETNTVEIKNDKRPAFSKNFDKNIIIRSFQSDEPLNCQIGFKMDDNPDKIEENIKTIKSLPFESFRDVITEFFLNITLNHNVLTEEKNEKNNNEKELEYQGSNPDEVALVAAASEINVKFLERTGNKVKVKIFDEIKCFEILHKFDFSSERMRSSIIIKDENNQIKLYMKGADTVILRKLDKFSQNYILNTTKQHIDNFAKEGLRTLCYSIKYLDINKFSSWDEKYKSIKFKAINDKNLIPEMENEISKLENDMILLGCSGLEDKLQDSVKNILKEFMDARINLWMLTGDKLDTAETIGYSCKIFNDDTEVFKIRSNNNSDQILKKLTEIYNQMISMENEMINLKKNQDKKKKKDSKNGTDNEKDKKEKEKSPTIYLNVKEGKKNNFKSKENKNNTIKLQKSEFKVSSFNLSGNKNKENESSNKFNEVKNNSMAANIKHNEYYIFY